MAARRDRPRSRPRPARAAALDEPARPPRAPRGVHGRCRRGAHDGMEPRDELDEELAALDPDGDGPEGRRPEGPEGPPQTPRERRGASPCSVLTELPFSSTGPRPGGGDRPVAGRGLGERVPCWSRAVRPVVRAVRRSWTGPRHRARGPPRGLRPAAPRPRGVGLPTSACRALRGRRACRGRPRQRAARARPAPYGAARRRFGAPGPRRRAARPRLGTRAASASAWRAAASACMAFTLALARCGIGLRRLLAKLLGIATPRLELRLGASPMSRPRR